MKDQELLEALEELAGRLDIRIRRESFRGDGGLCRLRGESMIIVNRSRTPAEQAELLARSLSQMDLDGIYIAPQVREAIERRRLGVADSAAAPTAERLAG